MSTYTSWWQEPEYGNLNHVAIFHLTATIISRGRGQSAVAAAAYRSATTLRDQRYGTTHYYAQRRVAHSEILASVDAPEWVRDRELLWNRVESCERRKDSQLARVIEVAIPVELDATQSLALIRDYVVTTFVSQGMIADLSVRRDNPNNPHAQILLTLRDVTATGFGPKARRWNGKGNLLGWRAAWADCANDHLARAGHSAKIDHRTLEAQQVELAPSRRVGFGRPAGNAEPLPEHLTDRVIEQRAIARDNGEAMLADPALALRTLAHQRAAFTRRDLAGFLRTRTCGHEQFDAVYSAALACDELTALPSSGDDEPRFTTRDLIEAARALRQRVVRMATRRGHGASSLSVQSVVAQFNFDANQRQAFESVMSEGDAKALAVTQDLDKAALLSAVHRACAAESMRVISVRGASASGSLESGQQPNESVTRAAVIVVDAAEMLDVKQLERVFAFADQGRAKVILLADAPRLAAMKTRPAFCDVQKTLGGDASEARD